MARRRKQSLDLSLSPETRRAVGILALFVSALLLLLGMFGLSGAFGRVMDQGVSFIFGWDKILLPFMLMAWAYHILSPDQLRIRFSNVVGFILFYLSLNPLVHLLSFPDMTRASDEALRVAGGKLGEQLALPLVQMLGSVGAIILTIALLVVAILMAFNASLEEFLSLFGWVWKGLLFVATFVTKPIANWLARREHALEDSPLEQEEGADEDVRQHAAPQPAAQQASSAMAEESDEEEEGGADEEDGDEDGEAEEPQENPIIVPKKPKRKFPKIEIPWDLLDRRDQKPTSGDIVHNKEVIRRTLDKFGIPVEMGEVSVGPTVTQFTLKPGEGVKLSRITGLHNDLALSLAAHPIRIEAPIPGKSLVGVEVPNQSVATVGMRELIETREFRERTAALTFILGRDVTGKPWTADLGRMPHMLVAGATGSGKSVCLNVLIMSFLYANGPDELKLIMVDPKRVELQIYNGVPHLLTPVITKVPETVNALKWALREMDQRYDLLAKFGARDIASYNGRVQDKLPYVVIVIDELADLMATAAQDVEGPIVRLAQMSRAVGIHLVLATQRPSVDVITGLIKANIPGRIAFAVASQMDSRTILDQQGAEKLLGRGDMLFSTAELATPKRIQGAYISETEISRVVEFIKSKYEPADYDSSVTERPQGGGTVFGGGLPDEDSDPLIPEAKEEIIRAGKASASLLQRRLKVGYARAARLLDLLEQEGFIGPGDGAKPREILHVEFAKGTDQIPAPTAQHPDAADEPDEDEEEDG